MATPNVDDELAQQDAGGDGIPEHRTHLARLFPPVFHLISTLMKLWYRRSRIMQNSGNQYSLTRISVSILSPGMRKVSLAGSTFQKWLAKTPSSGNRPFVTPQRAVLPHCYLSQVYDNTPSQVVIPFNETASRPFCFCPLPKMWMLQ